MSVTILLSGSILNNCGRCREHTHCYPLEDDQQVRKHFCVACIAALLDACHSEGEFVSYDTNDVPVTVALAS